MNVDVDNAEPVLASVEALRKFFLRQFNTQLSPVWKDSEGEDSLDYVEFEGTLAQVGLTGVRSNRALSEQERVEIANTFQSIIGGILSMRERLAVLRQIESHQAQQLAQNVPQSNVVPLRRPQNSRNNSGHIFFPKDNRWILKLDCLIESPSHTEIAKMARELHDHSHRLAFVEFRDLDSSARTNSFGFTGLGSVTVFVPDIFQLTHEEQVCLTEAIRQDASQRPLIMVGTHMPFALLKLESEIQSEFLQLISRAYLKLIKPVEHYKKEGLFHYFLDSLT